MNCELVMLPCSQVRRPLPRGILIALVGVLWQQVPAALAADSPVITDFLQRFDAISRQGFVRTQRRGDTGVGYTLESLLGLKENNAPTGDFRGMEVKAWRIKKGESHERRPMNLFLKEPEWLDNQSTADRIQRYGYVDDDGRQAWYQSVSCRENSQGLRLQRDHSRQALLLLSNADAIGYWTYATLQRRLLEKHSETVFVGAEARGSGASEEFHYTTVIWCRQPSLERCLNILEQGDVIVELRMHNKSDGTARNHGTAFRIRKDRIRDLYGVLSKLRPLKKPFLD